MAQSLSCQLNYHQWAQYNEPPNKGHIWRAEAFHGMGECAGYIRLQYLQFWHTEAFHGMGGMHWVHSTAMSAILTYWSFPWNGRVRWVHSLQCLKFLPAEAFHGTGGCAASEFFSLMVCVPHLSENYSSKVLHNPLFRGHCWIDGVTLLDTGRTIVQMAQLGIILTRCMQCMAECNNYIL